MDRLEKPKQFLKDIGISDQGYQDEGMFDHIADVLAKYDEHQAKHNEVLDIVSKSACVTKSCKFNKDNECIRMDLYNECIHKSVC